MPTSRIKYICVEYGLKVLCEEANIYGDFLQMNLALNNEFLIDKDTRKTLDFSQQFEHKYHYINEGGLTYLLMADPDVPADLCFNCLEAVQQEFLKDFGKVNYESVPLYGLDFKHKLRYYLKQFNGDKEEIIIHQYCRNKCKNKILDQTSFQPQASISQPQPQPQQTLQQSKVYQAKELVAA